jgi:lactoylglutathione lyase
MKRSIMLAAAGLALAACAPAGNTALGTASPEPTATASAAAQKDPMLSAVGIGVSDLAKSAAFYKDVMGMVEIRTYHLDYMDEIVLGYPDAESYIVLMHWTDGSARNYTNLPIKIVTRTRDPAALAARIRAAGFEVTREPGPSEAVGGATVGFAKDPDGYVLELLPLRPPAGASPTPAAASPSATPTAH